jgi:Zn-finger protein
MKAVILCSFCGCDIYFESFEELEAEMVKQFSGGSMLDLSTILCEECLNDTEDHGIDIDDDMED